MIGPGSRDASWPGVTDRIEGVTFRGLRDAVAWLSFTRCELIDCVFEDCTVDWDFGGRTADQQAASVLTGCRFVGCDMREFRCHYGRVIGSVFQECDWRGASLSTLDLVDNRFVGVVESLTLFGVDLPLYPGAPCRDQRNVLRGNDFRESDLRGLGLRAGVPVEHQRWPQGEACAVVDRVRERVVELGRGLRGRSDPEAELLRTAIGDFEFWDVLAVPQDSLWMRWDDPIMPERSNTFHRALSQVKLTASPGG